VFVVICSNFLISDPLMIYKSDLDDDDISDTISQKYPALCQFLKSPDNNLLLEILTYPCLAVLKKLIKSKFTKLAEPKNLLQLIEKMLPYNSTTTILLINLLRYCNSQPFVSEWIRRIRTTYDDLLQQTSFTLFYNYVIDNDTKNFYCEYFIKITPQLESYIEFFLSVNNNHEFYINLLFEKEITNKEIAQNTLNYLVNLEINDNLILLYNSVVKRYNLDEYNINLKEVKDIIDDIKKLNLKRYFAIIESGKPYINKEFYHITLLQSRKWDGYLQILFWKILIYQRIAFDWTVPDDNNNNDFGKDALMVLDNLH
ncbi:hypothetical protein THOM_2317, partial [Trachipleistophora hominis]